MTRALTASAVVALVLSGCGGATPPPKRRVIETNVDAWSFRRYQQVVDIEVWVPKNRAVAHTASYVRKAALKRGRLGDRDVVNAFVTEYKTRDGVLRAVVKFSRRLAQESGYVVEQRKLGGVRVISVTGYGEAWALWGSGKYVVKIGGRGLRKVPPSLVEAYGQPYPSTLSDGVLEGPLPDGPDQVEPTSEHDDDYDPNRPRPHWDRAPTQKATKTPKKTTRKKRKKSDKNRR